MSNTGSANEDVNETMKEVAILFGACALMLFVLVIFRVLINVIIIDVCILGDCSAWKKLCICFRHRGDNSNTINDQNRDVDDVEMVSDTRWGAIRFVGTVANPSSYLYSGCPEEKKRMFLNSITDSELLEQYIVTKQMNQTALENDHEQNVVSAVNEEKNEESPLCSICLQGIEVGESCSRTKTCSHKFHTQCIKSWIDRSLACPVCRKQMISNEKLLECMSNPLPYYTVCGSQ